MIHITDGEMSLKLNDEEITKYEGKYRGYLIKPKYDYWLVELIIREEDGYLKDIVKMYCGGDEVLVCLKNKIVSKEEVKLSKNDFKLFKKLYDNMRRDIDYRKEAIISAYAELLSYEYYQATVLEDCSDISEEDVFAELGEIHNYKMYRSEILNKAKTILNDKYKI